MLIPKSYLTTPKPPAWYYDYEKHMTHINDIFDLRESAELLAAKERIEKLLPSWVRKNPNIIVAGGCWASTLHNDGFKDIDVFILDCNNLHKEGIRDLMKVWDCEDKTEDYARNNDKVTEVWTSKHNKIQFIFTKHQTRKDLINDFDYVHCKTSYSENKLYTTRKIYDAIMNKHLIVQNNKNIQQWRKKKFLDRGYKVTTLGDYLETEKEPTLGDILAGALRNNAKVVGKDGWL
jgi:hypothetical protein